MPVVAPRRDAQEPCSCRVPVTIAGPVVFGIIGHSLALRNANNPHDRVLDPMHGRITGV